MIGTLNKTAAEQCRELGINVCDTIIGYGGKAGNAILTLLWLGESVAVWRVREQFKHGQGFKDPVESAAWNLAHREWDFVKTEHE